MLLYSFQLSSSIAVKKILRFNPQGCCKKIINAFLWEQRCPVPDEILKTGVETDCVDCRSRQSSRLESAKAKAGLSFQGARLHQYRSPLLTDPRFSYQL